MRKVTLEVRAKVMVPVIVTYTVTANADEGVLMEKIARAAIQGRNLSGADIEDSFPEIMGVEGDEGDEGGDVVVLGRTLNEEVEDYLLGESPVPKYINHTVVDSR